MREHKTKLDFAEEIAHIRDVDYPDADVVVLVMDNFPSSFWTHKIRLLYDRFPSEQARACVKRLEIHPAPKRGSGRDVAEIELSLD